MNESASERSFFTSTYSREESSATHETIEERDEKSNDTQTIIKPNSVFQRHLCTPWYVNGMRQCFSLSGIRPSDHEHLASLPCVGALEI